MTCPDLHHLLVCRDLLSDPLIQTLQSLQQSPGQEDLLSELSARLIEKAEQLGLSGNLLPAYLTYQLIWGDNTASRTLERSGTYGPGLEAALASDMAVLLPYLRMDTASLTGCAFLSAYVPAAPVRSHELASLMDGLTRADSPGQAARILLDHYKTHGSGSLARFTAFRLSSSGHLTGIRDFPDYDWDDLIAYQRQKEKLLANTQAFLAGHRANNVLLTGARGTGKSTAVKALVSRYRDRGLRLVQIARGQLSQLSAVMERLCASKNLKFILFFDDLSFDEGETEYKYLKSVIDGGVTPQPDNVLIYATSNRRHLLRESWQDRSDQIDDIYMQDSANESISLSDRFGLILHYAQPTQEEYLAIIRHELEKAGITLDKETLRILGVRWEHEHSGRNGRIAHQFVTWYLGQQGLKQAVSGSV